MDCCPFVQVGAYVIVLRAAEAEGTRALAEWFRAQGAQTRLALHPGGHEVRPEELTALAELFGEP